ncbi:DUF202 domain-containing protein [Streptomyces apocyni]|uniref:DUF202 domain-containing protein n=1 Tax=Streptomyces apocyni TaxID=2654677 RepID=UPI0012EA7AA1|nr:DUF202 domain-containing protein [Streptomyces apocyni]
MSDPAPQRASEPDAERDAGLQPERTRLAWRRTTLTCTVAASLAARQTMRNGGTGGLVALAGILLIWLGFLALAHFRITTLSVARPRGLRWREALATVGCAVTLAACAMPLIMR